MGSSAPRARNGCAGSALVRAATPRPFAVGFISAFLSGFVGHFGAALEEKVPVIALSFGELSRGSRSQAAGAVVMCQVQTLEAARAAVAGGRTYSSRKAMRPAATPAR